MEITRKGVIALAVLVGTAVASIRQRQTEAMAPILTNLTILQSGRAFTLACMWASAMGVMVS